MWDTQYEIFILLLVDIGHRTSSVLSGPQTRLSFTFRLHTRFQVNSKIVVSGQVRRVVALQSSILSRISQPSEPLCLCWCAGRHL